MTISKGNSNSSNDGSLLSSRTWTHVVANNADRLLLVSVSIRAFASVTSVTYNGQALTKLDAVQYGAGNYARVEIWYLLNPPVGSYSVYATVSGADYWNVNSTDWYGVNQTSPFVETLTSTGGSSPASNTVTPTTTADLAITAICIEGTLTCTHTQNWLSSAGGNWRGGGGYQGNSIVPFAPAWTTSGNWALITTVLRGGMTWTAPVYDRTLTDITNRTSKAFMNVADWLRIYKNSATITTLVSSYTGAAVTFDTVTEPSITTIPAVTDLNKLVGNIARAVVAFSPSYGYGLVPLKTAWREGYANSPTWQDVNKWEQDLAIIHDLFAKRKARTGVSTCGVGLTRNNKFRS